MAGLVAILEDEVHRINAMRACLAKSLPQFEIVNFEDAQTMISWLKKHLAEVILISLDHDLLLRNDAGQMIDSGTGRQVADHLVMLPPTCPVIVHSSNNDRAPGMFFSLKDAGWPCSRVYPCDGETWIADAWDEQVRRYCEEGWIKR